MRFGSLHGIRAIDILRLALNSPRFLSGRRAGLRPNTRHTSAEDGHGLLALDWFMAPRKGRRLLVRAKNQNTDNVHAGYAEIQRQGQSAQQQTWLP